MHFGHKIKSLAEQEKLTANEIVAILGRKSRRSAYDMYNKEDINTKDLRTIAGYFNITLLSFFEENLKSDEDVQVSEPNATYSNEAGKIELLEKQLKAKDDRIEALIKEIARLELLLKSIQKATNEPSVGEECKNEN